MDGWMWAYRGHTCMRRCWQTQQLECSRAWNASLEHLSHRLHCSRTISWEFFYIINPYLVLSGVLFVSRTAFLLSGSLTALLHLSSYLYKSAPASPHLWDRWSHRLSKHVLCAPTPPPTSTHLSLPTLHPPKHSPIGWESHQVRMNEQVSRLRHLLQQPGETC